MKRQNLLYGLLLGIASTVALGCLMASKTATLDAEHRYDAYMWPGPAIYVTDHESNTLYLYTLNGEDYELSMSADLTTAGNKKLGITKATKE